MHNKLQETIKKYEGYHVHFIETKKFKTIQFIVKFRSPLHRETITKRALLPYILEKGTVNYPTEKSFMRKLDDLYGASLSVDANKQGNHHIINFRLEIANEKFLPYSEGITEEALQLLQEVIFHPHITGDCFPEEVVRREKITLKNEIEAITDDKVAFSNKRLIEEMCEKERFSIATNGYVEDLPFLNEHNMYTYYEQMLQDDRVDVYVLGDINPKEMEKKITHLFDQKKRTSVPVVTEENVVKKEVKNITEIQQIHQAKLHIGYRTNCTLHDEAYAALLLFNGVFGTYPNSKLFQEVREKESLAYYATSRLESHKGLLIVMAGIEGAMSEKTKTIIFKQLEAMQQGDFTEEIVEETKRLYMNDLRETLDHPRGIVELLYQQTYVAHPWNIDTFMERISDVTKEEIVKVANQIELDTVYLLTNEAEVKQDA